MASSEFWIHFFYWNLCYPVYDHLWLLIWNWDRSLTVIWLLWR